MKNHRSALLLATLLLAIGVSTSSCGKKMTGKAEAISLSNGKMEVGGKVISGSGWKLSDFQAIYGEASRLTNGANDLHSYDTKGFVLFETPQTGIIAEFTIYMAESEEKYDFLPKSYWTGPVTIEGVTVKQNTPKDELVKKLPKYNLKLSYQENVYRGSLMGTYIFVHFTKDLQGIASISFGVE